MAVAYRAGAVANDGQTTNVTTVNVTIPASAQVGDVAMFVMAQNTGSAVFTGPAGWTSVSGPDDNNTTLRSQVWAKQLGAGEAGTTAAFTSSASARLPGALSVFSGVDYAALSDAVASLTTAGTTHTSPPVTTSAAGVGIVSFWVLRSAAAAPSPTVTLPGTHTADSLTRTAFTASPNYTIQASHLTTPGAAGNYGGLTATSSLAATSNVYTIALPAAAPESGLPMYALRGGVYVRLTGLRLVSGQYV